MTQNQMLPGDEELEASSEWYSPEQQKAKSIAMYGHEEHGSTWTV